MLADRLFAVFFVSLVEPGVLGAEIEARRRGAASAVTDAARIRENDKLNDKENLQQVYSSRSMPKPRLLEVDRNNPVSASTL